MRGMADSKSGVGGNVSKGHVVLDHKHIFKDQLWHVKGLTGNSVGLSPALVCGNLRIQRIKIMSPE